MLSQNQLQHRCLLYGGTYECRYLSPDTKDWQKYHCMKLVATKKRAIDKKVNAILAKFKQLNRSPHSPGNYTAIGDGGACPGYPYMPTILQGYDQ